MQSVVRFIVLLFAISFALCIHAYDPPTMGWSSWNTYRVNISDSLIKAQADALVSTGLSQCGYKYVNIDDGYFGGRDTNGTLLVHPKRFPQGLRPVVEHIHRLGLKAGIYSDAGRNTCGNYWDNDTIAVGVGLYGHDVHDATFFFDSLKFDFIKIDFCGGDAGQNKEQLSLSEETRYTQIRQSIAQATNRPVRINICRWAFPGTWVSSVGSSWRISSDINPTWQSVRSIIAENRYLSAYAGHGTYNDMDMLEIGRGLTPAEERTHFGMWCMLSSPLLIGCDLTKIPKSSLLLLCNKHLIGINQDSLGLQAHIVRVENGVSLYVKDVGVLNGHTRAVAIYNSTDTQRTFSFHPRDLLLGGRVRVYDAFAGRELSDKLASELSFTLAPHDTQILLFTATERFSRIIYEAETAWLNRYQELGMNQELGYAYYQDDEICSAGAKVVKLGNHPDNWLEWRDVYVPASGEYSLSIFVSSPENRRMQCFINGKRACVFRIGSSDKVVKCRVRLRKGKNVVRLSNPDGWAPDVDKMDVLPL